MDRQAFVVTGLGFGDEGKGTTTHWLSCRNNAHTVIRTGGPQALHHVVTSDGKEHVFSQFGSGTFRGAATHLSKYMLVEPSAVLHEGEALMYESGMRGVFDTLTIHEDALVITPFQAIAGRVRELLRGKNRRGSVGIGVGETILDAELLGENAVRAKDLSSPDLRAKLVAIQKLKWAEFEAYADRASGLPEAVGELVRNELSQMNEPDTVQWAVERFGELALRVRIVNTDYVADAILGPEGTVVIEGSQGVLLDRLHGFHPYTTKVRTLPHDAIQLLEKCGYTGEVTSLGVLRAYHTRHGGGPFTSESEELTTKLPDAINKDHAWQGSFRVGHFDLVAAKYALAACGQSSIDGMVITCLDRVWRPGAWQVCDSYVARSGWENHKFFEYESGRINGIKPVVPTALCEHLERQEQLGRHLQDCSPHLTDLGPTSSVDEFTDLCVSVLEDRLMKKVVAVSLGPTERDKVELG